MIFSAKLDKKELPEISGINKFGQNTHQEHVLHSISSHVVVVLKIKERKEAMVL